MSGSKGVGFYDIYELCRLSSCLGFPSTLFLDVFRSTSKNSDSLGAEYSKLIAGKSIAATYVKQILDDKYLHHRIDKVFNNYSSKYNVKVIKKVLSLLKCNKITYAEISNVRIAFEAYSGEDKAGLSTDVNTVLHVLKMAERVISPLKLQHEIKKQQHYAYVPSQIQHYEFFDLFVLSSKISEVESEMKSTQTLDGSKSTIELSSIDFNELLMTTYQRMLAYLDTVYQSSMYKEVQPSPDALPTEHTVSAAPRRDLKLLSRLQYNAFSSPLEQSQLMLHQARVETLAVNDDEHYKDGKSNCLSIVSTSLAEPCSMPSLWTPYPSANHTQVTPKLKETDRNASKMHSSSVKMQSVIANSVRQIPKSVCDNVQSPALSSLRQEHKSVSPNTSYHIEGKQEVGGKCFKSSDSQLVGIGKECIMVILKAREALASSLCNSPQNVYYEEPARPSRLSPLRIEPCVGVEHRPCFEPIVSLEECRDHQARIDDLNWTSFQLEKEGNNRLKVTLYCFWLIIILL